MFSANGFVRSSVRAWVIAAMLFGGTLLLFNRAVSYGFTNYDDPRYVTNNPHVQAGLTWDSIRWAFVGRADYWHPLAWLSHLLDWQVYGDNAPGHHLTSVLWHALNAVLVFVVLRRLTGALWMSALAAALFAWHPLRVESVAWVAERKDVMSGCFLLLTIWVYAVYTDRRRERREATLAYAATLGLFALALMCKPTVVTLPLVLLALDYWPFQRLIPSASPATPGFRSSPETGGPARESGVQRTLESRLSRGGPQPNFGVHLLLEKIPFFALSLITAWVTVRMQRDIGAFTLDLPIGARLANAPVAIARYIGKFFWPADLAVCYSHPGWWPATTVAAAAILVVALTAVAWRCRKIMPWLIVGWCWFVALLLPTIGIVQVGFQSLADRYTYLPMIGWTIALLWTLRSLVTTRLARIVSGSAAAAAVCAAGIVTWQQEEVWRDPETLFRHAITATGDNDIAEAFLGYTLSSNGEVAEAIRHSQRALVLNPRNEMAVYTLAGLHALQGRIDDAIAEYRTSLRLRPNDAPTEFDLGLLLLERGNSNEAALHLHRAAQLDDHAVADALKVATGNARAGQTLQAMWTFVAATVIDPSNASAHYGAGVAYAQLGRFREAQASLTRALELRPGFTAAHVALGGLLLNAQNPIDAAAHFQAALAKERRLVTANVGLGRAEEQLGRTSVATQCFTAALAAAPDDPAVNAAWAETLARRREFSAAVPYYRHAVELRPGDAGLHAGLGYALFLSHRRDEAVAEWKEALRLNPNFPGLREQIEAALATPPHG